MAIFGGMRGGGGGSGGGGNRGKASAMFMQSLGKKPGAKGPTSDEQYKKAFEDRLNAYKKGAGGSKHYTFALPGTQQEARKMSKSAEMLLEQLAAKKAQQDMKKARKLEKKQTAEAKRQVKQEMLRKQKEAAAKGPSSIYGSPGHNPGLGQSSPNNNTGNFWGGGTTGSTKKDDGWW